MTDTWTWATVTQATPLRIKVDGDTTALDATTDDLVGSLAVLDRVRVHLHSDGIIVTGIQGGGNGPNPNLVINSNFMVNQEGKVSGATINAFAYLLDGWYNPSDFSISTITWADSGGTRTLTIGAVGAARYMREIVESGRTPAGTYTLSWEGTCDAQMFYVGDPDPGYAAGPITRFLDGTTNVVIGFQGSGGTVRNVKLERGPTATPYVPPTYDDNLRACMGYFQRHGGDSFYAQLGTAVGKNATTAFAHVNLFVPMRALPSISGWSNIILYDGSGDHVVTALSLEAPGKTVVRLLLTSTTLLNKGFYLMLGSGSGNHIDFDARL